ncbi:hypothetical protein N7505_007652 [Penicillium chrysogenum]|uniref:Major facilitator superfamily (MFS) profile domain-containing protein n=1 Tax=Penicillium chrysogenum TaxID=5076 RepID=A0ABQ8WE81_PENCH|nr:hypothetical protein N7505_007652 [Penicillium chrysogenum]
MFNLEPWNTASEPIRPTKSPFPIRISQNRLQPPDLPGHPEDYLVDLAADDDPANAKAWSLGRKTFAASILGFHTLVASWGSSVYSPTVVPVSIKFNVSEVVAILGLTLYICGFATGPVAFAPLSELYGRKWPLTVACFIFTCFMFACATAKDFQTLMICRFFAGIFASCPLAVVGGAFADIFGNETRGIAIAAFSAMVFLGPFISPIVGGFITQSYLGWRWAEYITGIMVALALFLDAIFLEETYMKTILRKRASHIPLIHKQLLLPLKLLFLEPIVFLITVYTAFIYGILYLFLEAYPIVFSEYRGISPALGTLPYIGLIVGVLLGCGTVVAFEPRYNRKLKENNGIPVPEDRLLPMMIGAVVFPIGLFWFAWTGNYPSIHWIVPTLSGLATGAAILTIFLQALNYLVDAYLTVAASAIAANTFLRSFFGAGFRGLPFHLRRFRITDSPLLALFATAMFHNLGVDWAGSVLGFLAVAFMPIPFLFYVFGERLRKLSRFAPTDIGAGAREKSGRKDDEEKAT